MYQLPYGFNFERSAGPSPPANTPQGSSASDPNANRFLVRRGRVTGIKHLDSLINNQDAAILVPLMVNGKPVVIGIIADGCTGGPDRIKESRNEVGANLLTIYAFSEIRTLLALGVAPADIPRTLYSRCVAYIGNLARVTVAGTPDENAVFVQDYFSFTLHGFIMTQQSLVAFGSGDGFFIINDQAVVIDQANRPLYMGYHLIDRRFLPADVQLPESFEVRVLDMAYLKRFAVGTDGLLKKPDKGSPYIDPVERRQMFSHRRNARAGLQWWLNIQQSEQKRFDDDTTILTVESPEGRAEWPEDAPPENVLSGEAKGGGS